MSMASGIATAAVFVWLGMVLAISFLEAPLKFRAPDVTVRVGLGIGRIVFRALNIAESVLTVVLVAALAADIPATRVMVAAAVVLVALLVQLFLVRPRLTRRSNRVLAGEDVPHARGHVVYVGLEIVKVVALLVTGILLLMAG